jgi:chemotaxis regulatin CheY-phosphate phosphatase CheZ
LQELESKTGNNGALIVMEEFLETIKAHLKTKQEKETYQQIELLSKQLSSFKNEASRANQNIIEENFIPKIAEELHLIVKHTEVSVDKILDIFDEISGVILKINNIPIKEELISKSIKILEVCNFQDNVGQRINIIVDNLGEIENTLFKMLHTIDPKQTERYKPIDKRPDAHLLNGPAINAPSQQEIDDLFKNI